MTKTTETLVDDAGIEIMVGYEWEQSDSQIEEGHGYHEVGKLVYTELTSVEVIIKGHGIDILPVMTQRQKDAIIGQLTYDGELA